MSLDLKITGGLVVDGRGGEPFIADVGVKGTEIVAVGNLSEIDAGICIEAAGKVCAPGFIDMHSHADDTLLAHPEAENFLTQGVTTVVGGNCGFSPAPLTQYYASGLWEWYWRQDVNPRMYDQEPVADLERVRDAVRRHGGVDITWRHFGEFLERVDQVLPGVNLVPLVGHSTVRAAVMGHDYRRPATSSERDRIMSFIGEAMDEGAAGVSNGLDYYPGAFADRRELVGIVREAAVRGGMFATHWRRKLRHKNGLPVLARGLTEAIEIAREAEAPLLQVSHLLPAYSVFPDPPQGMREAVGSMTLQLLDDAIEQGLNIYWDVIPSRSGGVLTVKSLANALIPWWNASGTLEQLGRNLRAPDYRDEIRRYLESGRWYYLNPQVDSEWSSGILIGRHEDDPSVGGHSLEEVAQSRGIDPFTALFDLLVADPYTETAVPDNEPGRMLEIFFKHPRTTVGLDTFSVDTGYESAAPPYALPHPNTYGGMIRYLKDLGIPLLGLSEAIHRVTGLPARILGLSDRGLIGPGLKADIAVFSPAELKAPSNHSEPRQYSEGIEYLLVNGTMSVRTGEILKRRGGQVLRS